MDQLSLYQRLAWN